MNRMSNPLAISSTTRSKPSYINKLASTPNLVQAYENSREDPYGQPELFFANATKMAALVAQLR